MSWKGTEKGGWETKADFSSCFSGATSSWNRRTSIAPDEEQMTFHVLTCPEASGQCFKVRWTEQRLTASNFPELSPGKMRFSLDLTPSIINGLPHFWRPYRALPSFLLVEVEVGSAIWKKHHCLWVGQALGKSVWVSWKLGLGRAPCHVPGPWVNVSISFYFLKAFFFEC